MVEKIKICPAKIWCPYQVLKKYFVLCTKKRECKLEIVRNELKQNERGNR